MAINWLIVAITKINILNKLFLCDLQLDNHFLTQQYEISSKPNKEPLKINEIQCIFVILQQCRMQQYR